MHVYVLECVCLGKASSTYVGVCVHVCVRVSLRWFRGRWFLLIPRIRFLFIKTHNIFLGE